MSQRRKNGHIQRPVLSVQELAERWAVDVKTIYQAIELGQLPAIRLSRRVIRIPTAAIEALERGQRSDPNES